MTTQARHGSRGGVVVTGASSGIGQATAFQLAREGFIVFSGFRSAADGTRMAALHGGLRPVYLDVTDRDSVDAAASTVAASGLALRGLVNNAGIAIGGPLEFLPIEQWRRQFDVNLFGAVMTTQVFLPQLRAHRGRIVFIGSVSGRLAVPFLAPYSASKFALRAVADALRIELAPAGIAVSIVEPGSVKTPIWRKGRESQHRLTQLLGEQAAAFYARETEELIRNAELQERIGMPVQRVTRAIVDALTARRPKTHYLVGSRLASAAAHLPTLLRDKHVFGARRRPN